MIQQFVESRPAVVITRYQNRQQQQVAVLDYIMATWIGALRISAQWTAGTAQSTCSPSITVGLFPSRSIRWLFR
ncbi:hypothetical protein NLM24_21635 [Nocardia zapadnayensis]|uniref:hypothetical protein n=1 Tax=Nocardia rhamnosiphila TaxID=426716 RepID=UPI002246FEF3|nr:hypothetical protein [Nocardia zapadnayensis]MCX0273254.1 hypothetical protein [Nocardia zapadnayensis]